MVSKKQRKALKAKQYQRSLENLERRIEELEHRSPRRIGPRIKTLDEIMDTLSRLAGPAKQGKAHKKRKKSTRVPKKK